MSLKQHPTVDEAELYDLIQTSFQVINDLIFKLPRDFFLTSKEQLEYRDRLLNALVSLQPSGESND